MIPRGHDHYWAVIRTLDKAGPWTAGEVVGESNAHRASVHDFVGRLVKAGIARHAGGERAPRYRLAQSPAATPRLRRNGTAAPPSAQAQLWCAIRQLGQFTYAELILAASTDELAIEEITARSYLKRLSAAGYITAVVPGAPGKPAVWKLKPSMNTGPKAPQILRAHVVFDPNRGAVVGGPVQAEEVSA
ncbi:hypothetical protein PQJ75_13705 [Rhodoplanes sp. TEM]|uniref:hypothetical protein n=1 Tax=Rhodoplanes TaxID=29407 RepID=UPI00234EFD8D|nr:MULTISPECIES: hypothetical protein [Rhodoplanes]MDC7984786.1 hypothetical protein [Rhodoplanes sp. TEM]